MLLQGYYFITTNIDNKRAHSFQIFKTVEAINKNNGNVQIISPRYKKQYNFEEIYKYYNIKEKINFILLYNFGFKLMGKLQIILFNTTSIIYLLYLKARKKIDFLYIRSELLYPLAFFGKFLLGINYYYEVHRVGKDRRERKRKKKMAKAARGIIALTEGLKNYYSDLNKNIMVAHDGVDLDRFCLDISREKARDKTRLPKEASIALYVGSLDPIKGVDIIINNAKKLPNVDFYLVGRKRGDYQFNIELRSLRNVHIIEEQPQNKIPYYLVAADLLILPHPRNIRSQSPMKLFEYMASGTPIITSDLDNIKEVVDVSSVIFYKADNAGDFMDKLKSFFNNQDCYNKLAANAREIVKNYTWEARARKICKLLF